ncbi:SLOG family protein [Actinomycetospora straminea]|uniref:YspA cpYpsA-related SLOG domain-containing protein n=1 Tax=Actinomycetospora straminea TaxID=663607 RepID=A0ABP9E0Q8_9PSEU|nr:SLOG family protein [Actinomycetospora straminea]MDD7934179.1 SLOG family protein [Actinomycetospora straminea]
MRVLVAGSKFWTDGQTLMAALADVWEPDAALVTGACPEGAEDLAARCWRRWGGRVERWEFDWDQPAGTVVESRHRRMLEAGADVCLTFGSLTGPRSLEAMSRAAGVPTYGWT